MTKQENEERLARLKNIVLSMPEKPGSYQYYDENHTIIYVGKAKNLKRRVSSYFHKEVDRYKTKVLVSKIFDISYTVVNTEEDALLLENSLIKKYNPRYNVLLKDGKTYPSICVTNEYFPRIFKTRNINKKVGTFFGPYPHVGSMYAVLEVIKKLYKPRTCRFPITKEGVAEGKYKPCLEYHIHNCGAPCINKQSYEEYIKSDAVPVFDPIQEYMNKLPKWDGKNHVSALFGRIPGLTSEQLGWCATWFRSAVAHWLQMDMLHGNEAVPVLIGQQGCGKSTFAVRLLPEELRQYFLDHINFGNKFDSEMALTHNLLVNIDELANITVAQQGKLKQTLSKVKVNGRPIFGKSQADRRRYASFLATTNDDHPLCDPTGSRRYLCLRVPDGEFIDNSSVINYDQLYAQMMYELRDKQTPYWFTNDEVARIQEFNQPFFKVDDLETMISYCFRMPAEEEEGRWMVSSEVFDVLHLQYPMLVGSLSTKIKIGQALKFMGCKSKHTRNGQAYQLLALSA